MIKEKFEIGSYSTATKSSMFFDLYNEGDEALVIEHIPSNDPPYFNVKVRLMKNNREITVLLGNWL